MGNQLNYMLRLRLPNQEPYIENENPKKAQLQDHSFVDFSLDLSFLLVKI